MERKFEIELGKRKLIVFLSDIPEKANGACFLQYGQTMVLSTVVMSNHEKKGINFFPLTVEYEERYYAAGKIRGPRYVKREGRPSDEAICNARLIDRAIRPLFPKELKREVQVINTVLSWDGENDPDVLGILATSLALLTSDIPWRGPVSALRVGKIGNDFVINPTYEQKEKSKIDVVFSVIFPPPSLKLEKEEILINMIEGGFVEATESEIVEAFEFALPYLKKLFDFQKEIQEKVGKRKIVLSKEEKPQIENEAKEILGDKLEKIIFGEELEEKEKKEKIEDLREKLVEEIEEKYPGESHFAKEFFDEKLNEIIHSNIVEKEKRPDGRKLDEIRPLHCEVGLIPRSHGSGLFCRGRTKSLSILTLGGPADFQLLEGMEKVGKKRFIHHYNFPPYCAGEIKPLKGPSRREIGHGVLVEKALFPLIPSFEEFPYTIRVVSEILSSNGSTSMAAVSSSSLALMDGGVPIKKMVSGIAIGLALKDYQNYKILTDIQGPEDHHGDMDFKIAGTKDGITAIQMDVKILGITKKILKEALERGKMARIQILEQMEKVISKPREKLSIYAPRVLTIKVNPDKIREIIGPGGRVIHEIIEQCEVSIDIEEDGKIFVTAEKEEAAKKAISWIKNITKEIKVGQIFQGRVTRILHFGALIEILPGKEALLHVSQFLGKRKLKPGNVVMVKVISIDELGRINLSLVSRPSFSFKKTFSKKG